MDINGYTRLAAVVANPIKHSLSPFIHNRAFELTAENGVYVAWELNEDDPTDKKDTALAQALVNIRLLNMYGVNLSMPYKQLAMWYVNDLSESAKLIGAINTIVNDHGQLIGHNTDGTGFWRAAEESNFYVAGQEIVILGGGGAAIAIVAEAALRGAGAIHVYARRSASFEPLAEKLAKLQELTHVTISLTDIADERQLQKTLLTARFLANATSVGMDGLGSPVSESLTIHPETLVMDVIYKVEKTPFLSWAESQGAKTANGVGMLLYQAAAAFKLWTGKDMPTKQIERELREKLHG
ncbi:MAG: shikimate dehydrogenase [Streptococcaceae bacterium]|jgi:shikimate dehydrogenase|nr:shikimate dehydrogenase [Streptococcaceae bacterium]